MTRDELIAQIRAKKSFLSIGLDTDLAKIPKHLLDLEDPIFEFNKQIIDATQDLCVAYKPNIAFYECLGPSGWVSLQKTLDYIPDHIFTIADAKRGDIGNTSRKYAETFFKMLDCDSVTVAPYMGVDSVSPFLEYKGKWVILLALTSNKGSEDFQFITSKEDQELYQSVLHISSKWGNPENMMFVVGATHPSFFKHIREIAPHHFLLVPGVGAQGGTLADVCKHGLTDDCGLLVNSSRGIIYAGEGADFADAARASAKDLQEQMAGFLS